MQKIFNNAAELEKLSKEQFSIPPFLMMENAAKAMADFILSRKPDSVLILCGKGNNGGDGFALARLLQKKTNLTVVSIETPTAQEASVQFEMCQKLGISITNVLPEKIDADIIVDCLYGIGFHGELRPEIKNILDFLNNSKGLKIACDIPSGLYFNADYTITMGEQKTALYSDKAKAVCGEILVADLGIHRELFESSISNCAYLLEQNDVHLPVRTNKSSHKGTYGHTVIFAGEKSGAAIICATASMNFGSGLTSLYKTEVSNLEQFKISPELMICDSIPPKATCIVAGPGLGTSENYISINLSTLKEWFIKSKNPNVVLDADLMSYENLPELLEELNKIENAKIILTPHLSELSRLLDNLKKKGLFESKAEDYSIKNLAESAESKIAAGRLLNKLYPKTTVIMKSANTFIASENEVYIYADGCQSLAKGGSGDVLAGLAGSLLSQGYSAKEAAITAVEAHGLAAKKIGSTAYDLTPFKLIDLL